MTLNNLTLDQCDDLMLTLITNQGKVAARKVYLLWNDSYNMTVNKDNIEFNN